MSENHKKLMQQVSSLAEIYSMVYFNTEKLLKSTVK